MMTRGIYLLLIAGVAFLGLLVLFVRSRGPAAQGDAQGGARGLWGSNNDLYRRESDAADASDLLGRTRRRAFTGGDVAERKTERGMSLQARLRYANLASYPPYLFSLLQIAISLVAFFIARLYVKEVLQIVSLTSGPLLVNWFINRRIEKRLREFDVDFPQFLLSVVGMLKTGLNTVQALEAAAEGLESTSRVRQEVELMLERFRVGVSEDRSIGSFAEDVLHPEVELFVQALILSRRVGGNLSETLDRLAKQVRKRQTFKMSAKSAVGMHRGSIWVIVALILAMQLYLYKMLPEFVLGTWQNPSLTGIAQSAIVLLLLGIRWMNTMTRFKV
jgi:tight adherence protein B